MVFASQGGDQSITATILDNVVINTEGGDLVWTPITQSGELQVNTVSAIDSLLRLSFTLPSTPVANQRIGVFGANTAGWIINQKAGEQIRIGKVATTQGTSGNIISSEQGDFLELVYLNNIWIARTIIGNFEVN